MANSSGRIHKGYLSFSFYFSKIISDMICIGIIVRDICYTVYNDSMVSYWNYLHSAKSNDLHMIKCDNLMPDESCRTCGGELAKHLWCSQCRKTIQKICKMCSRETLQHQHMTCLSQLVDLGYLTKTAMTG